MVLISFTNIVVDEFSYGKRHPMKRYIYFLTHMHSDHYQGISAGWNYGTIYCSKVTKNLLLNKFPLLPDVRVLEMNTPNKICLHAENKIEVVAYAFDANHCPGSVMYMFEGYFGRILHTGDMRFNENLIFNNPILYPPSQRNAEMKRCSLQIDECIFDNTYCDPIFKFPKRERACEMLVEIIEKHKDIPNVRFLICVDSVGKEELLVFLSQRFETLIVVNEQRYQSILCMDIPHQLFTTQRDSGWIEVIRKGEKQERLASKNDHCISITCTGWANISGYITKDNRDYLLPYSLHSNFEELELFIRSIYPSVLNTVVRNSAKGEKINNITQFSAYMITLMNLKQRGVEFFGKNYVDFSTVSKQYASLMTNAENIQKINCALGLELTAADKLAEDSIQFNSKYANIFQNKKRLKQNGSGGGGRGGAKLSDPSENSSFSMEKFLEIKQSVEEMKEKRRQSDEQQQQSQRNSPPSDEESRYNKDRGIKRAEYYDPIDDKLNSRILNSQNYFYDETSSTEQNIYQREDSTSENKSESSQTQTPFRKPYRIVRKQQLQQTPVPEEDSDCHNNNYEGSNDTDNRNRAVVEQNSQKSIEETKQENAEEDDDDQLRTFDDNNEGKYLCKSNNNPESMKQLQDENYKDKHSTSHQSFSQLSKSVLLDKDENPSVDDKHSQSSSCSSSSSSSSSIISLNQKHLKKKKQIVINFQPKQTFDEFDQSCDQSQVSNYNEKVDTKTSSNQFDRIPIPEEYIRKSISKVICTPEKKSEDNKMISIERDSAKLSSPASSNSISSTKSTNQNISIFKNESMNAILSQFLNKK